MRLRSPLAFALVVTVLIVATMLFATPHDGPSSADDGRPAVSATIFPLYDIVRNVGGDAVDVRLLLPPGASPHTFEPSPSTLRDVTASETVYAAGLGLDAWIDGLAGSAGVPVKELRDGIALHVPDAHEGTDGEADHAHEGADPHYWLSIGNAKRIADTVAADLSARHPELAPDFAANLAAFDARLDALREETSADLADLRSRRLVTMHDAWYYFAEENGLEITASFEPVPGREPTPRQLAALAEAVRAAGVAVVYSEPQLSTATIEPFVADLGLTIAILDPLGGTDDNDSYENLMRHNTETVAAHQR